MIKVKFSGPVTSNVDLVFKNICGGASPGDEFAFPGILQLSHDALRTLISHLGVETRQEFWRS